jgi:hypothetical protein
LADGLDPPVYRTGFQGRLLLEVLPVAYEIESNDFVQTHGAFTFMKPFEKELDVVDVSTDG